MINGARKSSFSITRDDVKLSDEEILRRYLGIDKTPCVIQSPLRDDDDTPSFSIFKFGDNLRWKDFGTGESDSIVGLMSRLWRVDYKEALLKIRLDSEGRIPRFDLIRRYNGKLHITSSSSIKVRIRPWKEWDIEFWRSFGISESFCKWCNVYPVSHAFFKKEGGREIAVPMDKYAYAYFEWKDGKQSVKLYQPYSKTLKWLSKHDSSVWDLWKHAFKWADTRSDEEVIITSSRKDAMCLWENLNVPAMSLQGEGYIPKPQVMRQVLDRFKTVYIWYDNDYTHKDDNPGQDNARKLIALYPELRNVCIPSKFQSKDPSDLVKNWGIDMLREVWSCNSIKNERFNRRDRKSDKGDSRSPR